MSLESEFQEEKIQVTDRFEVTGYSHKPFYKLSQEENKQLDAKNNKSIIFFKATLIKADEPSQHRAIINGEWVRKHKGKWTGLPITMGHPDFKSNIKMKGRPEEDIVKDILKFQENYAVGRIMKVDDHPSDKRLQDFYGYLDNPDMVKGIANGEVKLPRYGSPYFWHLGQIDKNSFDNKGNFLVNDHAPIHWAFVNSPAMGQEIEIRSMCSGEEMACLAKMQSNSIGEDSHFNALIDHPESAGIVYSCPARFAEEQFNGLDKSFYVVDPLSSLKMSSNEQSQSQPEVTNKDPNQQVNDFMEGGKKNLNKNTAMPPSSKPGEEGQDVDPGQQTDRNKEAEDAEKKPEEQDEKTKMEAMIEEVRAKAEKSVTKKFEKTIAEKDGEIAKLNKTISDITFKEKETLINDTFPDEIYGGKEEDKKKASEEREFFIKLSKEKDLSTEQLTRLLQRVPTKELKIAIGTGSNKKGIANSAEATPAQVKEGIKQFTLSNKTTNTFVEDSKTTPDQKKAIRDSVTNFLGGK